MTKSALENLRLTNLENNQTATMKKLDDLQTGLNEINISIAKLPETLTEKFDQKYASKDTENNMKRLTWIVIGAIVLAIINLVLKVNIPLKI